MSHQANEVKPRYRRKFDKFSNPSPEEISPLWRELCGLADLAPEGQKPGVHRLRTALLTSVPQWNLPHVLDQLQEATA